MKKIITIFLLLSVWTLSAQTEIGLRAELYPAGVITNAQITLLSEVRSAWNFKIGYNDTNRRDWGEHDSEEGGGFGFGTDFRRYFKPSSGKGLYAEAGFELWWMEIDWTTLPDPSIGSRFPMLGQTNITVLQPTIGVGYQFLTKNEKWSATVGLTIGREINIRTKGEEVGQGGISILSASVMRRL